MVVLRLFAKLTTEAVNNLWEGLLDEKPSMKPHTDSEKEKRIEWVKLKYIDKAIVRRVKEGNFVTKNESFNEK